MKHPDRLTRAQAAEALGVTPKTLVAWEKNGKIPTPQRDWRGWRLYDPVMLAEIRKRLLGDEKTQPGLEIPGMELSARNRFVGIVKEVNSDRIMSEVVIELQSGEEVVSLISRASARRLRIRIGDRVCAIVKSTDVMLAR